MANADAFAVQRSDLNGFLFADVGVEPNGMTLSVLSALARLGMDPWDEAARLARQPRSSAAESLARMIATMPSSPWAQADSAAIAARLVALLPARGVGASTAGLAQTATAATRGKEWISRLPLRRKSGAGRDAGQRSGPSTLVLVLLAGLLAGLTLCLLEQRQAPDATSGDIAASPHQAAETRDPAIGGPGTINKGI